MSVNRILAINILIFFLCNHTVLFAQTHVESKPSAIDSIIIFYENSGMFNGSIIVIDKQELIFSKESGYSDKSSGSQINAKSIFGLASISKIFTSTAIMKLVEEKKLSLEKTLDSFFPDLPSIYSQVSLKNILTHTSGIPDFHTKPVFDVTNEDIFKFAKRQSKLEFIPGTKYKYSNTGFVLLAMIIEKIEDISFPVYLEKEFFKPLGMKDTFVNKTNKKKRIVKSYHSSGEVADRNNYYYGCGEIYSSSRDMVKWDNAYFSNKIVSEGSRKRSLTANKLLDNTETNYGLGWGVLTMGDDIIVGHTGGNYGFRTIYMHNTTDDYAVIILTNIGDKCPTMEIMEKLIKVL